MSGFVLAQQVTWLGDTERREESACRLTVMLLQLHLSSLLHSPRPLASQSPPGAVWNASTGLGAASVPAPAVSAATASEWAAGGVGVGVESGAGWCGTMGQVCMGEVFKTCGAQLVLQTVSLQAGSARKGALSTVLAGGMSLLRSYAAPRPGESTNSSLEAY